jgi:hypothetical protein
VWVATTLTAPDTALPESDIPVVPLKAILSVGSGDEPLALPTSANDDAAPTAAHSNTKRFISAHL